MFTKIIRHIRHFQWLDPNVWCEISQIRIEYIKPIGQISDESWKFWGYTAYGEYSACKKFVLKRLYTGEKICHPIYQAQQHHQNLLAETLPPINTCLQCKLISFISYWQSLYFQCRKYIYSRKLALTKAIKQKKQWNKTMEQVDILYICYYKFLNKTILLS